MSNELKTFALFSVPKKGIDPREMKIMQAESVEALVERVGTAYWMIEVEITEDERQ